MEQGLSDFTLTISTAGFPLKEPPLLSFCFLWTCRRKTPQRFLLLCYPQFFSKTSEQEHFCLVSKLEEYQEMHFFGLAGAHPGSPHDLDSHNCNCKTRNAARETKQRSSSISSIAILSCFKHGNLPPETAQQVQCSHLCHSKICLRPTQLAFTGNHPDTNQHREATCNHWLGRWTAHQNVLTSHHPVQDIYNKSLLTTNVYRFNGKYYQNIFPFIPI